MAAFTPKERDTGIFPWPARRRREGTPWPGSISQNTSRKFSRKYMKNEGLRTPC